MKVLIITGGNIDDDFAFSFLEEKNYDEFMFNVSKLLHWKNA